jgi:hypothetical protein
MPPACHTPRHEGACSHLKPIWLGLSEDGPFHNSY